MTSEGLADLELALPLLTVWEAGTGESFDAVRMHSKVGCAQKLCVHPCAVTVLLVDGGEGGSHASTGSFRRDCPTS